VTTAERVGPPAKGDRRSVPRPVQGLEGAQRFDPPADRNAMNRGKSPRPVPIRTGALLPRDAEVRGPLPIQPEHEKSHLRTS
jgi:hypothetical protein